MDKQKDALAIVLGWVEPYKAQGHEEAATNLAVVCGMAQRYLDAPPTALLGPSLADTLVMDCTLAQLRRALSFCRAHNFDFKQLSSQPELPFVG